MKFNYRILLPEQWPTVYDYVEKSLPDILRSREAFYQLLASNEVLAFELGAFEGVFWVTRLRPGRSAFIHVVLWGEKLFGKSTIARDVMVELMTFLKLKRMEAWIPATNSRACRYAEKTGMVLEGVRRQADTYDGQATDMAIYAYLKED